MWLKTKQGALVAAQVPTLPQDSRLLSLPFGGAVLRALNYGQADVDGRSEEPGPARTPGRRRRPVRTFPQVAALGARRLRRRVGRAHPASEQPKCKRG